MNQILKNKFARICILVVCMAFSIYAVNDFIGMARRSTMRRVSDQMAAAAEQFNKSQVGIQRAETFLNKLKAIDTSATPADFEQAFNDYSIAFEKGLDEMKSTGNTVTSYDNEIAEKKAKLSEVIQKHLTKFP